MILKQKHIQKYIICPTRFPVGHDCYNGVHINNHYLWNKMKIKKKYHAVGTIPN